MRSLEAARRQARVCRAQLGEAQGALLQTLVSHLKTKHQVRIQAVAPEYLDGGAGEIDTSGDRTRLLYDRRLDEDPAAKLELFAHEYAHLVLHSRLTRAELAPDPLLGSIYLAGGAPSLARYHPRSREEAEANAFATEFVCPADEVFARWMEAPGATPESLAEDLGVSAGLVRVQLAEGFHRFVTGARDAERGRGAETPTNQDQEDAATRKGVPVLLDAGPGTGKTKTLVRRVVHLLAECGQAPNSLLVLTFTREAAEELRDRVAAAVGEEAAQIKVATFHEFGVEVLYDHGQVIGLPEHLRILDQPAMQRLVGRALGRAACDPILKLKDLDETAREAARHITFLKDRLITPECLEAEITASGGGEEARALHTLYVAYEREKEAAGAVDFADLVLLPIRLLENTELRERFRQKYRWVMVDEYQDVSRSVATLLQRLCGAENPPWVVGDARQAIYRFRGAAPENVTLFPSDFPGGIALSLRLNYRSSEAVVEVANRLAALMPEAASASGPAAWTAATQPSAVRGAAVELVEADSDAAEHAAVAERVRRWMTEEGVPASDIAVLARRNVDVRNIALALHRAGIPATTAGLLTPEGAAGDLAAVLALLDAPRAAVPRLIHAFGRGKAPVPALNAAVRQALDSLSTGDEVAIPNEGPVRTAAAAVRDLAAALAPLRSAGDAWDVLSAFLFGGGSYLREILARRGEAGAELNLEEVRTTLSLAAVHRFTAPPGERRASRLAFAAELRRGLAEVADGTLSPPPGTHAVRVMTCHASKGLEFPFVAVAGQSLPLSRRGYPWLPATLAPGNREDLLQADALLFVAVTRAQRAVSVSFASSRSALPGARARPLPGLLVRWREGGTLTVRTEAHGARERDAVVMGSIWGGRPPAVLTTYALTADCAVSTYLDEHLGIDFPPAEVDLYPKFIWRCRRALQEVARLSHEREARVSPEEAVEMLRREWPEDDFAGHPHLTVFRPRAVSWVRAFAEQYDPGDGAAEVRPTELELAAGPEVRRLRTDLVAHASGASGTVAVLFRPDALAPGKKGEGLNWSSLKERHRLPFILLQEHEPALRPHVFVGPAGRIFPFNWSTRKREEGLRKEAGAARASLAAQTEGRFEHVVDEYGCDRCSRRVVCPVWSGALEDGG